MSRDFRLYLADIIECCDRIRDYADGHTLNSFSDDHKTIDAVARNLEIIGEAVKNIPPDILSSQSQIEWKDIARFRDVIAHYYFRVNLKVVWRIVQDDIDPLRSASAKLFESLPDRDE